MKKLLGMFAICLLAVPAMALYPEGYKIVLPETPFHEEEELECEAVGTDEEYGYHFQYCWAKDRLTGLYLFDDPEVSALEMQEAMLADRNYKEGRASLSVTRGCRGSNTFVHFSKETVSKSGKKDLVQEVMAKMIEGKGWMALSRWCDPEDSRCANMDDFVLWDVRRLTRAEREQGTKTDFDRLCEMEFPGEDTK